MQHTHDQLENENRTQKLLFEHEKKRENIQNEIHYF